LEADSDRSAVEAEIAEGVALPRDGQLRALSAGPWLEPARLVVEPVPRQRLLGDEPLQAAISDQADRVVDGLAQPHGETEARHQAPRRRKELLQHLQGGPRRVRRQERVFAPVTGDAELG